MNVIIGNSWPYANGPLHLGRIAVLMPGDILARYHRLMGDNVVFISGSDSHGTLVDMKAKEEGITPLEAAEKYHNEFVKCFKKLGFSFDVFTKTHTKYHSDKVQKFILDLYRKGYIYEKEVNVCDIEHDDSTIEESNIHNNDVEIKKTKHLFFALSKFEKDVRRIYIRQNGWRENAQVITKRYLDGGLRDRAVTREFNWGIDVPLEGYEDKKIYVWIEAVLGYLTASMKCIKDRNEDYLDYWNGEDSIIYFVHGKDNIPFHTVIFPGLLAGLGIKNPSIREISSEYLKLEGKQFSTAKNWALWVEYLADKYNVDLIRYYLMLNGPETKVSDFTWRSFVAANNNDLVGLYDNFVNRTLSFIIKNFNGNIPKGTVPKNIKDDLFNLYFNVGDFIEQGRFRDGLNKIISNLKRANNFFDFEKPWETINTNTKKCEETIYICVQYILNFSNLFEPFMPLSSEKIRGFLNVEEATWSYVEKSEGKINNIEVLFEKIERKNIVEEVARLKEKTI